MKITTAESNPDKGLTTQQLKILSPKVVARDIFQYFPPPPPPRPSNSEYTHPEMDARKQLT